MQKQGRLQDSGGDVAPINGPVEVVQLAGVLEGIGNERYQAENIEVGGSRRSPAAQQHVKPDAKVNKRNQAQPVVKGMIRGDQNHAGIERNRLPDQGIRGFGPDAGAVELALQPRHALNFLPIDRDQLVARLDATLCTRSAGVDPVGGEAPAVFHPPDAIVGNGELPFRVEIEAGEDDGSHCQQEQKDGNKADLALPVHGFRR